MYFYPKKGEYLRKLVVIEDREQLIRFYWYLRSQDIDAWIDTEDQTNSTIWLCDEGKRSSAIELYDEFKQAPSDPKYESLARKSKKSFENLQKEQSRRKQAHKETFLSIVLADYSCTFSCLLACVIVFLFQAIDPQSIIFQYLAYSTDPNSLFIKNFSEISRGQIWRLVTPIFMHGDFIHLLFNLYWFFQFGKVIEENFSSKRLFFLILFVASVSNTAFYLISGPHFLGISGVNYGLLTYLWSMNELDSKSRGLIDTQTVFIFVVFYCIGLVLTLIGMGVANSIHGVGALMGAVIGSFHSDSSMKYFKKTLLTSDNQQRTMLAIALFSAGILLDYVIY